MFMVVAGVLLAAAPVDEGAARRMAEAASQRLMLPGGHALAAVRDERVAGWYVVVEGRSAGPMVTRVWVFDDGSTLSDIDFMRAAPSRSHRNNPELVAQQPNLPPDSRYSPPAFPRERAKAIVSTLASDRYGMRNIVIRRADWDPTNRIWIVVATGSERGECARYEAHLSPSLERVQSAAFAGQDDPKACAERVATVGVDEARASALTFAATRDTALGSIVAAWPRAHGEWQFEIDGSGASGVVRLEVRVDGTGNASEALATDGESAPIDTSAP